MNTTNQNNNTTAAPSVAIAPRARTSQLSTINPQPLYVVTLTTFNDVRSYPCRSLRHPQLRPQLRIRLSFAFSHQAELQRFKQLTLSCARIIRPQPCRRRHCLNC
jgi:hypothetical protein